jgi:hypothetical protein
MKRSTKKAMSADKLTNETQGNGVKKKGPIKRALIAAGVMIAARFVIKKLTGSNDQPTV